MSYNVLITTPRLTITDLRPEDEAPHTRLMLGDDFYDHFLREIGKAPNITNTAEEEMYAIRLNDSYIGWIVLQKDEQGRPDVGIKLMREYQNCGYGPEALRAFCNWVYEKYGVGCLYARIEESNVQSQKAFAKIGAVLDERKPDYRFLKVARELGGEIAELLYYHIDLPIANRKKDDKRK